MLLILFLFCVVYTAHAGEPDTSCNRPAGINYDGIYRVLEYPEFVIENDIYGFVAVNGLLDTNGYFQDLYIKESYCELLNSDAFDAVRKVRHLPARKNCRKIAVRLDVTVFFLAGSVYPKRTPVQHILWNYDKALQFSNQDRAQLYYQRGMQFFKMSEDSLARLDYKRALHESKDNYLPYFDELIYERIQQYLPAISDNSDSMLIRFRLLQSNFLYQKAQETLDTLIFRPNADFFPLLVMRAGVYMLWKKYDYAIEDYLLAYQIDTTKSFILKNIGSAYYAAGRYDSSMFYSLRAFEKDTSSSASILNYALAKLRVGYVNDAKLLYSQWVPIVKKQHSDNLLDNVFLNLQGLLFEGIHTEVVEEILSQQLGIDRNNFWQLW